MCSFCPSNSFGASSLWIDPQRGHSLYPEDPDKAHSSYPQEVSLLPIHTKKHSLYPKEVYVCDVVNCVAFLVLPVVPF